MRNLFKRVIPFILVLALLLPCIPAPASAAYDPDAAMMEDLLNVLGSSSYRKTYNSLLNGRTIKKGSEGDYVKGLQKMLKTFGESVNVNGKANSNTIECMQAVQKAFGLTTTTRLNLEGYKQLLVRLLIYKSSSNGKQLLVTDWHYLSQSEYEYIRGCIYYMKGNYYKAKTWFEKSGWSNSWSRAASCERSWPDDGKIWQSSSYKGSHKLIIRVKGQDYNWATVYKVYDKSNNKHVATLFIGANGKASVSLPSGKYYVKRAQGQDWYGKKDLFGDDAIFERLVFSNGNKSFNMKSNYASYTITTTYY